MREQARTVALQVVGFIPALSLQPLTRECFCESRASPSPQQSGGTSHTKKKLYSIEVEDAIEAGLIEQQLKIKPEFLRGHTFLCYGDEAANASLRQFGYFPAPVEEDSVFTQIVRVALKGNAQAIRELGVTMVLAERTTWVVRASPRQVLLLRRLGYQVIPLGPNEPRPRQVRLIVGTPEQVAGPRAKDRTRAHRFSR